MTTTPGDVVTRERHEWYWKSHTNNWCCHQCGLKHSGHPSSAPNGPCVWTISTLLDAARPEVAEVEGDAVERALDAYINWSEWKTWAADDVEKCRANMRRALTAARATAAPDDNALPTDLLPEGVGFSSLIALKEGYGVDLYSLSRKVASQVFSGTGPTPRAAMLAAIKAAGPT